MSSTIFNVSSVTNAMKGKALLERNGIRAYVSRALDENGNNGCGYSITTDEGERGGAAADSRRHPHPEQKRWDVMIYLDNAGHHLAETALCDGGSGHSAEKIWRQSRKGRTPNEYGRLP